ncbi:MAG: DNA recombination protein RmuC [Porticoccaceae bacterium]|nr:DNA recombination protein RmuC [Porticoccaceae bacterium]
MTILSNPNLTPWLWLVLGVLIGATVSGLVLYARFSRLQGRLASQFELVSAELERFREDGEALVARNQLLHGEKSALEATLASERHRFEEQQAILRESRETLTRDFENLANRIFTEKQASFSQQSKQTIEGTVEPLRRELSQFRKQVEDAYSKENAERNQLIGQIQALKAQAERIGDDALQLARALKGDSKVQGNWGEVVLERLLEESGLRKGREYETQVSLQGEDGRRRNPDVVLHLPDKRDIVIDAKVSLRDYEACCRADTDAERQHFMARHLASIRNHINGLSKKSYEQLEGVNSLDFVLIFVPVEAAFMAAIERDHTLFRDAYDQGIILVSPSTLLATLRTIHNIWRYEDQNRNAQKIAAQAGGLYDQFVLVIESLDEVGRYLDKGQEAWLTTRKRLVDGRGNLVKRLEDLKRMGARARKSLPEDLRLAADQDAYGEPDGSDSSEPGRQL